MKFVKARPRETLVNITPLIDVVFILLVFFMLAGAIKPKEVIPIELPRSASQVDGEEQEVVIQIAADGSLAVEDQAVGDQELRRVIGTLLINRPDVFIQLKADANAEAVRVIEVLELLRESGAAYVALLTIGGPPIGGP
ncbi:MAG: ExbD/TolR family protein [Maricaulaceae bacterium]